MDDNITSNLEQAKEFFRALIPSKIRWVSQASINAAHDEEFLDLLVRSGCQGVFIGFRELESGESQGHEQSLQLQCGAVLTKALENLRKHRVRLYGTFIFGYDRDTPKVFGETVTFAQGTFALHRGIQSSHAVSRHALYTALQAKAG